jgi:hypothetical protein
MDSEQFEKINRSISSVAAAILTTSVVRLSRKTMNLKDIQATFNDCYMIVAPEPGTQKQTDFQTRIDKKEW